MMHALSIVVDLLIVVIFVVGLVLRKRLSIHQQLKRLDRISWRKWWREKGWLVK